MTKQRKIGAVKINTSVGAVWCHYSQLGDTVKLRQYFGGKVHEVDIKKHLVPLQKCRKKVDAPSHSCECYDVWVEIFEKLEAEHATPDTDSSKTSR